MKTFLPTFRDISRHHRRCTVIAMASAVIWLAAPAGAQPAKLWWLTLTLVGNSDHPGSLSIFGGHTLEDCQMNGRAQADRHNRLPREGGGRWEFTCEEVTVTR